MIHEGDDLEPLLKARGAAEVIDHLCARLDASGDLDRLFYALLLKKRHQLNLPLNPRGSAQALPESVHAEYEDAIRDAGRRVGHAFLARNDLPGAWNYFRMLNELAPMKAALDNYRPGPDLQAVIAIAYHEGAHPRRGFELVLDQYGICAAITLLGEADRPHGDDVHLECVRLLIRALHADLRANLADAIAQREGSAPPGSFPEWIASRPWLFEDDGFHVDCSHLHAVVQMSLALPAGDEVLLARELCAYGRNLTATLIYESAPPFEQTYVDHDAYLAVRSGQEVEAGLNHFRAKLADAQAAAEILVRLLGDLGRWPEAARIAREHGCNPFLQAETFRQARDYDSLARLGRENNDPFLQVEGLIEAARLTPP